MNSLKKSKEAGCIIGIDPGLANIGIAALKDENTIIKTCFITTPSHLPYSMRLVKVQEQIEKFLSDIKHKPHTVYYEENFNLDIKINITLGVMLGAIKAKKTRGMNPKWVKQMIDNNACTEKQEIIHYINNRFRAALHCPHQADAVLIALAGMSGKWEEKNEEKRARLHRLKKSNAKPIKVVKDKGRPNKL